MSLDIGDRTIGIAVSDLLGLTAQGVETIRRKSLKDDLQRLGELMEQYETKSLVSGLPKNMNGTEGDRCTIVKEFMEEVRKVYPDVEVNFWDERLVDCGCCAFADRGGCVAQKAPEGHR
jgi:putative Holliday junction resolvase